MTRISITGTWISFFRHRSPGINSKGFTLLEIILVIILMGIVLSLTMPRVGSNILSDEFKSSSRKLIAAISGLRSRAIREHRDFDLIFNLDSGTYWFEAGDMPELELMEVREQAVTLPETVQINGIIFRNNERITTGEAKIRFSKKGYITPSIIHLTARDGRKLTFELSPFLGKVKVLEDHIDFSYSR